MDVVLELRRTGEIAFMLPDDAFEIPARPTPSSRAADPSPRLIAQFIPACYQLGMRHAAALYEEAVDVDFQTLIVLIADHGNASARSFRKRIGQGLWKCVGLGPVAGAAHFQLADCPIQTGAGHKQISRGGVF